MTAVLDGPRARGAFVLSCALDPPWAMAIRDEAPLTLIAVIRGEAWVRQHDTLTHAAAGTCVIVVGPEHYDVTSESELAPAIVIHPGQRCETVAGESVEMSMRLGVRRWGHRPDAATALLVGTYEHHSALARDVLSGLSSPIVVRQPPENLLLAALTAELANDRPGQQTLLDRLLDAYTVDTLRRWYEDNETAAPAWWTSHRDPIIGEALTLIHDQPHETWTISTLARAVGTSRANLARRFTEQTGQPVISYLTNWRMSLAADLLHQPDRSVAEIGRLVGYANPFAFSTAFKRHFGISPNEHRRTGLRPR